MRSEDTGEAVKTGAGERGLAPSRPNSSSSRRSSSDWKAKENEKSKDERKRTSASFCIVTVAGDSLPFWIQSPTKSLFARILQGFVNRSSNFDLVLCIQYNIGNVNKTRS